ncbi:MAG TPA: NADH-quinone oxidoreductase subunit J [Candidatus Binatia bacterium]|nr:NADH-quinone oxidoreductase subunit J [Candidatus Binatia bacterium]
MTVLDIAFNPGTVVFLVLAAMSIVSAILVVEHKSLIYAALFLGTLGMANAALFVMLGFSFIALFFVTVYIGAAVTFILFSVTMFQEAPKVERPVRIIAFVSVVLTGILLVLVFAFRFSDGIQPVYVSYRDLASLLTEKYGFALIIAALTLITTLIEGITIARKEEEK